MGDWANTSSKHITENHLLSGSSLTSAQCDRKGQERKARWNKKRTGEAMIVICQGFGENRTGPFQEHKTHIQSHPGLKYMLFLSSREETDGERMGAAPHPPDAIMPPRTASFCSPKCWAEERGRHKEQTGLSAGHSLCHRHSQAAGQSRQLPGHLVSPLPAALTWHRVDCGSPAGAGCLLQWSFSH